jgi:hypothetical protein
LEKLARTRGRPLAEVRLRPPLPRPSKVLCTMGGYMEDATNGVTTVDEVADVARLPVRLWVNGEIRHDYNTSDAEYPVDRLVAFASSVMTLEPGDVIACGTNHQGIGAIQDGDHVEMEIDGLGRLAVDVRDPLKRTWPRGIDKDMAGRVLQRRRGAAA